ncbi:unnamed protein product [Tilletia caries]|nr:unnamed protein product [Tilletia caries]CAD7060879.1 unnamed protein product [Tilletia caries]
MDTELHPWWKCPQVEMNLDRRYEAFFYDMCSVRSFIDDKWSRVDLLRFVDDILENGLNGLPDVNAEMQDRLRTGNVGLQSCEGHAHAPHPFNPHEEGDVVRLAPFPCRLCWRCANASESDEATEPAVSDIGVGAIVSGDVGSDGDNERRISFGSAAAVDSAAESDFPPLSAPPPSPVRLIGPSLALPLVPFGQGREYPPNYLAEAAAAFVSTVDNESLVSPCVRSVGLGEALDEGMD